MSDTPSWNEPIPVGDFILQMRQPWTAKQYRGFEVAILQNGAVKRLVNITSSEHGKKLARKSLADFANGQADDVLNDMLLRAERAIRDASTDVPAAGPRVADVVKDYARNLFPEEGCCRMKSGAFFSDPLGREIYRSEFVTMVDSELVNKAATAIDAPRARDSSIKRPALLKMIEAELKIAWGDLSKSLPAMRDANLGRKSAAGRAWWKAMVGLWHRLRYSGRHHEQNSPAAEVRDLLDLLQSKEIKDGWQEVIRGTSTYVRMHDGQVYLAARHTIGDLPGVVDQDDLTHLGVMFEVVDADPPVFDKAERGNLRLAVLTRDFTNELLQRNDGEKSHAVASAINETTRAD